MIAPRARLLLIGLVAMLGSGCGSTVTEDLPNAPTAVVAPTPIVPVPVPVPQPTQLPVPGPGPAPAPAPGPAPGQPPPPPSPSGGSGSIAYVRVGFFGFDCPKDVTPPNNNDKQLPVGCRGFVTATPKREDGTDVPFAEHGPNISWSLQSGHGSVSVQAPTFANDFNRDLVGLSPGGFSFCASVQGVTGCLGGQVIP